MDSSDIIAYLADKDTLGRGLLGDEVVANHLVDQITNNLGAVDSEHDSYAVHISNTNRTSDINLNRFSLHPIVLENDHRKQPKHAHINNQLSAPVTSLTPW